MSELDEQLEELLDVETQATEASSVGQTAKSEKLPLSSHHVKVHETGPLELDMHAMEHVLASFCNEHQLAPGPASLLLGELGLANAVAMDGDRCSVGGYVGGQSLNCMD